MRYLDFLRTDLSVSKLCLGTAGFGTKLDEKHACEQMNYFIENGGNFIDTAHIYGDLGGGNGCAGISEKLVGKFLEENHLRDKVVLCTKGGHPDMNDFSKSRVTIPDLKKDLAESLENLRTDSVDIYFMHRDNPAVPASELIEWMEEQKRAGKFKYYGCSNWTFDRIYEAQSYAYNKGFEGFICNQSFATLADVNKEALKPMDMVALDANTLHFQEDTEISGMAYMSLANGYFMKRLAEEPLSEMHHALYDNPVNDRIADWLKSYEAKDGTYSITDLCLGYLDIYPFPMAAVAGFSSIEQLKTAMQSCDIRLPENLLVYMSFFH